MNVATFWISSDQKRLFFAVSLYPLSFFANTPYKEVIILARKLMRKGLCQKSRPSIYRQFLLSVQKKVIYRTTIKTIIKYLRILWNMCILCKYVHIKSQTKYANVSFRTKWNLEFYVYWHVFYLDLFMKFVLTFWTLIKVLIISLHVVHIDFTDQVKTLLFSQLFYTVFYKHWTLNPCYLTNPIQTKYFYQGHFFSINI